MRGHVAISRLLGSRAPTYLLIAVCAIVSPSQAFVQERVEPASFASPEAAADALLAATHAEDMKALATIFGSVFGELLSGDQVQDRADVRVFGERLASARSIERNADGSATLLVGANKHPFAFPLLQKDGKWYFDGPAGKEELLNRRIGENELRTIAVCLGYVVAQREYAEFDRDGDDVLEFAQRAISTPGQKDGLYWETADGEDLSPLGPLVAEASRAGYATGANTDRTTPRPYHGYVYRILTKQGGNAPGGKFDYIINGNMIAGYALLAYPIEYGRSGVVTFQVNANGRVMQKDLGEKTAEIASVIDTYMADDGWVPADDDSAGSASAETEVE